MTVCVSWFTLFFSKDSSGCCRVGCGGDVGVWLCMLVVLPWGRGHDAYGDDGDGDDGWDSA